MHILVTGGCGFIGSNFIMYMLKSYPDVRITNLDLLTYAGNLANLDESREFEGRYRFVRGDIADRDVVDAILADNPDVVVNFAAESHVDRSILDSSIFVKTNILGTQVLLDACRQHQIPRFVQISTDEVYGSLGPTGAFTEQHPIVPNSPYAASKASADLLVRAYHKTHNLNVVTTRCSNNYGPFQFPEKLIPLMITNAMEGKPLPVYGDGFNVRDWIYVTDHCRAVDLILQEGKPGETYNIGAGKELPNIEIVKLILKIVGKSEELIRFVEDRPGHDRRYAMDASKLQRELGWKPLVDFEEGMAMTVKWYIENTQWWRQIKSGEYLNYYDKWYGNRVA